MHESAALLHVDGNSDRWRMEDMLMVRIDAPPLEEVPFAGFHFAQSWKLTSRTTSGYPYRKRG